MARPSVRRTSLVAATALAAAGLAACSSSTDPKTPPLSVAESRAVADSLLLTAFDALGGSSGGLLTLRGVNLRGLAQRGVGLRGAQPGTSVHATRAPAARPAFTTFTTNFSAPCRLGGQVSGSATDTETLDANGTGTQVVTLTYTPQACVVSTGTRTITVNGAPSIAMSVTVPFVQNAWVGNATLQMSGGFGWAGGTCTINYTASVTQRGTGTITGSVCGQDVSGSFP